MPLNKAIAMIRGSADSGKVDLKVRKDTIMWGKGGD